MSIYFVTGKLGAGKTLAAVGRLQEYAQRGNLIAGNLDIFLEFLTPNPMSKTSYTRLPDRPKAEDFFSLGNGNTTFDEDKNGLIVLDELMTWFNSRSWQEKGRKELLDWFVHARKYGWDIIFLVQSIETVDKQLIESLMEFHVPVSNLSKINVPLIGGISKLFTPTGRPIKLPKIHKANVMYKDIVKADTWLYRGTHLYKAYDTKQVISENYDLPTFTQLSRFHTEGRYLPVKSKKLPYFGFIFYYIVLFAYRLTNTSSKDLLKQLSRV